MKLERKRKAILIDKNLHFAVNKTLFTVFNKSYSPFKTSISL